MNLWDQALHVWMGQPHGAQQTVKLGEGDNKPEAVALAAPVRPATTPANDGALPMLKPICGSNAA